MVPGLSYHYGYMRENFSLIAHSQMKLCLFKVAKSDACIRLLFANPVTITDNKFIQSLPAVPTSSTYIPPVPVVPVLLQVQVVPAVPVVPL